MIPGVTSGVMETEFQIPGLFVDSQTPSEASSSERALFTLLTLRMDRSTLIASHAPVEKWHHVIGDPTLEAIRDPRKGS